MEVVRSGFCGHQDGGSGARAVFGGVGVGQDFEFLDVVDLGKDPDSPGSKLIIVDAVKQPIRAVGARAAYRQ